MSRKLYIKNPERFVGSILTVISLVVILMFSVMSISFGSSTEEYVTVYVCKGDTLWSIANDYYDEIDIRERVAEIKSVNQLKNSTIREGQELLLVKK